MILAVASGKGGTGKTTVSVNLAKVMDAAVQVADCDVDAGRLDSQFLHINKKGLLSWTTEIWRGAGLVMKVSPAASWSFCRHQDDKSPPAETRFRVLFSAEIRRRLKQSLEGLSELQADFFKNIQDFFRRRRMEIGPVGWIPSIVPPPWAVSVDESQDQGPVSLDCPDRLHQKKNEVIDKLDHKYDLDEIEGLAFEGEVLA